MTSERKIAANRRNARRSTGPRTVAGKQRVSRNALRHGLSVGILADPTVSAEAHRLAGALTGKAPAPDQMEAARVAAEAELEIARVRMTRASLINRAAASVGAGPPGSATQSGEPVDLPGQASSVDPDADIAPAVWRLAAQLGRLDRYERRALSRRKRAIFALAQIDNVD